jgi:probable 2-oxoglutarate dehydrogenase E1 component DHKTD1
MIVIVPTTPANYFHALRRQLVRNYRKPLIIVGPKTLLRHPDAVSSLSDMGPGTSFQAVLPDTAAAAQADQVTRLVFLSGKVYYDLVRERASKNITNTAFIRLEELSPFPYAAVREQLAAYPNAKKFYWLQEEQQNAGGWSFVAPRLAHLLGGADRLQYIGRGPLSSSAVGTYTAHHAEVAALMRDALNA